MPNSKDHYEKCRSKFPGSRLVKCLGDHEEDVWFYGDAGHRFCKACTAKREREPAPARAAGPVSLAFDH